MASSQPGLTPLRRGVGAALVVLLLVGAVLYYRASTSIPVAASSSTTRSGSSPSSAVDTDPRTPASTPAANGQSGSTGAELGPIQVYGDRVTTAKPSQTVRFRGTYHGAPDTFVHLERRDGATWVAYPYEAKTDWLGRFITHVEISQPGPHWLRVVDPGAGLTSEPFVVLVIEG